MWYRIIDILADREAIALRRLVASATLCAVVAVLSWLVTVK
jgi:hypothetical protein